MKSMNAVSLACACASALLLAGCFEATKPLGSAGSVPFDPALLGAWTCVPEPALRPQDKATVSVRNVDQHTLDITWTDPDRTTRLRAYGTKVESTTVLNVLEVAPHAKWFFVRYQREGSKLKLRTASAQEIKGGYEARKMDDLKARIASDDLFTVVAMCTKGR